MQNLPVFITVPFIFSLLFFIFSAVLKRNLKNLAFFLSFIPLIFFANQKWLGGEINYYWFKSLDIHFHLRVDALSWVFLFLTALIVPAAIFAVNEKRPSMANLFYGLIFLTQGFLILFFTSRDLAIFTVFWEAMLIPLFFIIRLFGGEKKQEASLKFLTYMIAGSILMIGAVVALYFLGGRTFNLEGLKALGGENLKLLFAIFLLAFAVKTPLFPFHGWLLEVYYEAPAAGTILLSALLSKAGIYGILRIGGEIFPDVLKEFGEPLFILALIGVFYGGFLAYSQKDVKKIFAYSSLSHVNFILAGLFIWNETARGGAIFQAVNHGIIITALFLSARWLKERIGSALLANIGGLAKIFPWLCWFTFLFILASIALPGTNSFIGEVLILFGTFIKTPWLGAILTTAIILSAVYMLKVMKNIYFGEAPKTPFYLKDLNWQERSVAFSFAFLILWLGIYPKPLLEQIRHIWK